MFMTRYILGVFSVATLVLDACVVWGQSYPYRPIRIVTTVAGAGNDFSARIIAQGITDRLGQSIIVDNRTTGLIATEIVSKSTPDGYTLLVNSNALWILPLMQSVPYDPVKDVSPVTFINVVPAILAVHPSLPIKSVKELIAFAKSRPGELNYASSATGTASHLSGELFKSMAGVNIVRIPYKGAGLAISDAVSGAVQLSFFTPAAVMAHIKSGKLRAVAVTTSKPSALFPELPTVASTLPGFETGSICGIYAPAKTPAAVVSELNREIVRFLGMTETKEKFLNAGSDVAASSPAQVVAVMKSEMTRMGKLIKEVGIREY